MGQLIAGAVFGLIATGAGTGLGVGLLYLLRRIQRAPQQDCPRCGKPGGVRATPSGRGANLTIACVTLLVLALLCGLPTVLYQALVTTLALFRGEPVDWLAVSVGGLATAVAATVVYAAARYVNWYRGFPLVSCGCGWRSGQ